MQKFPGCTGYPLVDHLKKHRGFHKVDSFFLRFWESLIIQNVGFPLLLSIVGLTSMCIGIILENHSDSNKKTQWPVKNPKKSHGW